MTDTTLNPSDSGGGADSGAAADAFDPANFDDSSLDLGENDDFDEGFDEFSDGGQADDKPLAETETQTIKPATADPESSVTEAEKQAVTAPQPEFSVAQIDGYLTELNTAYRSGIKNLAEKYDNGELNQTEFEEAKLNLQEEFSQKQAFANGEKQKLTANQQATEQAWNNDVQAFLKEQPDYADPILQSALSGALQAVAKTEAGKNLSNKELLAMAAEQVGAVINKAAANLLVKNRQARQQRAVGLKGSNAQTTGTKAADSFSDAFDFFAGKK